MRMLNRRSIAWKHVKTRGRRQKWNWTLVVLVILTVIVSVFQFRIVTWQPSKNLEESSMKWYMEKSSWKLERHHFTDQQPNTDETSTNADIIFANQTSKNENGTIDTFHPSITTNSTNSNTTTTSPKVRFLYGIMSYDKKIERRRRQTIRRTYLSFYRNFTETPDRICALVDVLRELEANDHSPLLDNCQILYTFVIGANPNGPTQLLEFNDSFPLTIDHSMILRAERDVLYLNIQENGKYGKSTTWFKYGISIWQSYFPRLSLDYIVKTDSDTALYPYRFFEMVKRRKFQTYPHNRLTYGGSPFDKYMCGYPQHDHCVLLQTPVYMGGGFYFLSMDLADYITGPECPRHKLFFPHEDMTTGNYVYSHPQRDNITWIGEKTGYETIWRHAVKNPNRLVHFYVQYLWKLEAKGIIAAKQIQAWNQSLRASSRARL